MPYYELTSTDQIRAVLTVDSSDLPDRIIEAYSLEDDMAAALDKALPDVWEPISSGQAGKQLRLLKLFAKYFCAGTMAKTAQVFVLKKTTDGSNEGQRSDKDGWLWLSGLLLGKAQAALDELVDDLGLTPADTKMYSQIGRVTPDRDPITTPRSSNVS
ncbi:hypothetical protein uan_056 [Pseudomonas phage UAntarctica]|nr:hypothetical protein uan_056 [Pseudomonas phage UAntarctica]